MDGNYNAENIYFSQDLITTSAVGNITLTNGHATVAAKGKNLKEVWDSVFIKEQNPIITNPSITLLAPNNKAYEVGSEVIPTYTINFKEGTYSYGPDTDIVTTGYVVTFDNETLDTSSGSFSAITVKDSTNLSIKAYASYTDGSVPVTNLGNEYIVG
jgi:hypothetical protein